MALLRILLIVLAVGIVVNIYLMGTARFPWPALVVWTILAAIVVYLRRGGSVKIAAKRSIDVIGRYGGDEFIMLLPSTDASAAAVIAEQVRSEMLSRSLYYDNEGEDKVSLTLGIASLRGRAIKSPEHLVKLADDALLHGKAHGRNTVSNAIINTRSGLVTFKCRQPSAAF